MTDNSEGNLDIGVKMSIVIVLWSLVLCGCSTGESKVSRNTTEAGLSQADPCIADLIQKGSYDAEVKRELSPKLSASIGNMGNGSIEFKRVSSDTIKMQVERNNEPFTVQMALAVNIAECMDKKASEYFGTDDFKKLADSERQKQRKMAFELTTTYRTEVLKAILERKDLKNGVSTKGPRNAKQILKEVRNELAAELGRFEKEVEKVQGLLDHMN